MIGVQVWPPLVVRQSGDCVVVPAYTVLLAIRVTGLVTLLPGSPQMSHSRALVALATMPCHCHSGCGGVMPLHDPLA